MWEEEHRKDLREEGCLGTRHLAPASAHISLGWRGVCTRMVLILDTCAQSKWDELPHLLVIMVPVSWGHSVQAYEISLLPGSGRAKWGK